MFEIVYVYEIELKDEIIKATKEEYNVVLRNDNFFVIDNFRFDTYKFKYEKYTSGMNYKKVNITDLSMHGNCPIYISITTDNKNDIQVKKQMINHYKKWAQKKFGRYFMIGEMLENKIDSLKFEVK